MKVLVTVASKHGATEEIGKAIADTLTKEGHLAEFLAPIDVHDVRAYDAVILGSGVYAGHWIESAKEFADYHAAALPRCRYGSSRAGRQVTSRGVRAIRWTCRRWSSW